MLLCRTSKWHRLCARALGPTGPYGLNHNCHSKIQPQTWLPFLHLSYFLLWNFLLLLMERQDTKDRRYRYEYLMATESFHGRNLAMCQHKPHVPAGTKRNALAYLFLAACRWQYSYFNNCVTLLTIQQTWKRNVWKSVVCVIRFKWSIKIGRNGACSTQEEDGNSTQELENLRREGELGRPGVDVV